MDKVQQQFLKGHIESSLLLRDFRHKGRHDTSLPGDQTTGHGQGNELIAALSTK